METKKANISNFNCTFQVADKLYPMLEYFDKLIYPALSNNSFVRNVKGARFYFAEVGLFNLSNTDEIELALIGKLVKRVELDIRNDYDPNSGFIPVGEKHPSAPYSTFVLLLRNHRLIYFGDQKGSPSIRSFAATVDYAVKEYKKLIIGSIIKNYTETGSYNDSLLFGEISKERFPNKKDLTQYISRNLPISTIDVVPIPHPNIVEEKIKLLSKIEKLSFRIFALNSELQVNDILRGFTEMSERMGTSKAGGQFNNPTNFDRVTEFVQESKGYAELKMRAVLGNNKITMSTDDFTENIYLEVPTMKDLPLQGKKVYNDLKDREELQTNSPENIEYYREYILKS